MAQLNLFNGGLSTRLAPHLIAVNEALVAENIDIESGELKPLKASTNLSISVSKNIYNFKDTWVSFTNDVDFVEYRENLYYSDGVGIPQKSSDGVAWYNLGIAKPLAAPTVALVEIGNLTGTYQYCYTYYNINDGTESMPSTYSTNVVTTADKVNITVIASLDTQVTNIRLYRLGGNLTIMSLVTTLTNASQVYLDNTIDTAIPADILVSGEYGQAPVGLKYLTKANAMFFGAVGDKLRFTEIAYVDAWSAYNFIDFDTTITGLGATQNGLLVFTRYATYIVTGTSPDTLSKYLLNDFHGCVSHKTIKYANGTLIWLSATSVCSSTGGQIQDISMGKLSKLSLTSPIAEVNNSVYYLASSTGILACDFRYGLVFYTISEVVDGLHSYNNTLYFSQGSILHSMFTGVTNMLLKYKSPKFADGGLTVLKNYKNIYVSSTGDIDITIKISDNTVFTGKLEEGFNDIKGLQAYRVGYYIQIEVEGTGTLSEIEYKVEGRQNGR